MGRVVEPLGLNNRESGVCCASATGHHAFCSPPVFFLTHIILRSRSSQGSGLGESVPWLDLWPDLDLIKIVNSKLPPETTQKN